MAVTPNESYKYNRKEGISPSPHKTRAYMLFVYEFAIT